MERKPPLFKIGIAVGVLLFFLILGYFYFNSGTEDSEILEINFISDHPVNENSLTPSYIGTFADVFEDENNKQFISRLSFLRTDADANKDLISFSKPIDAELPISDAKEMFSNERSSLPATLSMGLTGSDIRRSLKLDTTYVTHFYLDLSLKEPDNIKYFNSASTLKSHIQKIISKGELFPPGYKQNRISILLLSKAKAVREKTDDKSKVAPTQKERIESPRPITPKIKKYNAAIKTSGNTITWNSNLARAQELRINFKSKVDGKLLVSEDISGLTSYYFSYSNSIYEASPIEITIVGSFADGSIITNSKKTTTNLECH